VVVPNSSCPPKIVREGRPFYLCRGLPYINRFHMVSCTQVVFYSASPSPSFRFRALSVSDCVSPSLPSHMHMSFVHRTHVTHPFPSCRPVMYARLGHRLTTFIGRWPCAARIAHCPLAGLIPRYRLDEFMSEVISIFPCSKPLSGGSQAHWLVLESHLFYFYFYFSFLKNLLLTLSGL
jgi:hypothetical protein